MTGVTRVQLNPSTLKASYIAANNTVQMVTASDCEHCTQTPYRLQVTFSGVTMCGCRGGGTSAYKDGDSGFNTTYILTQQDGFPCYWRYDALAAEERFKYCQYTEANCQGDETCVHKDVVIFVEKMSATKMLVVAYWNDLPFDSIFLAYNFTPDSGCLNVSNEANDQEAGSCWDDNEVGDMIIATGGTVTVVEL